METIEDRVKFELKVAERAILIAKEDGMDGKLFEDRAMVLRRILDGE